MTSAFNPLAEHLVVSLDAFDVVRVLQQDCTCQFQQSRGKGRGWTGHIEGWPFEIRHDLRIGIVHPGRVERGVFPAPGHARFDLVVRR